MVGLFDLSKYVLGEAHTLKVIWTYESHRHPHTIGSHLFYISSGAAIDSAVITPNIPFENDRSNSIWKSTHWIEGGHSSWTFAWLMAMVIKSVIKYFFPPFLIPPPSFFLPVRAVYWCFYTVSPLHPFSLSLPSYFSNEHGFWQETFLHPPQPHLQVFGLSVAGSSSCSSVTLYSSTARYAE